MSAETDTLPSPCEQADLVYAFALQALPSSEVPAMEAHIAECARCQAELESLAPVLERFVDWPTDVLRPPTDLWSGVASRIAAEAGTQPHPSDDAAPQYREPEWKDVAPGISCKLLSVDHDTHMVSMLVRLAPGAAYPPHRHAGVEELHLLDGELWIEDRKLFPGDYNRAEPGTGDKLVWSETGCTCVLITSARDELA